MKNTAEKKEYGTESFQRILKNGDKMAEDIIFFISAFSLDKQILLYINFIIFIKQEVCSKF